MDNEDLFMLEMGFLVMNVNISDEKVDLVNAIRKQWNTGGEICIYWFGIKSKIFC